MQRKFMRTMFWAAVVLGVWAGYCVPAASAADEAWIVSTRGVPGFCGCQPPADAGIEYCRLDAANQWIPADAAAFFAAGPALPVVFVVPGNRSDPADAVSLGWQVRTQLKAAAPNRPFRLVIWSWPADRIQGGNLTDVRVKAARCDVEAFLLAQTLDRLNPQTPVSLVGYSFGARIIADALELTAGGAINGQAIARTATGPRVPMRAVLVAAAMDCDWLMPGNRDGLAPGQVERMLVTVNGCDRVLRHYGLMYQLHGPDALGATGPACGCRSGTPGGQVDLLDVGCAVGREHDWCNYLSDPDLIGRLAWYAFLQP